ncbi:hypothetical protein [Sphingomonas sp. NFR15]|uniref:hypothetical protein n=1 Tax=Sphingomonas sp. NFR15 TaxID=1566282 RepID=UPI0015A41070|nr:hypothetical protein [Sphingomonas sp. NFR15]
MKLMTAAILMLSCVASVAHARETQVLSFAAPRSASPGEAEATAGDASPTSTESEATPATVDVPGANPINGVTSYPTDRLSVPAWMRRGGSSQVFAAIPAVRRFRRHAGRLSIGRCRG